MCVDIVVEKYMHISAEFMIDTNRVIVTTRERHCRCQTVGYLARWDSRHGTIITARGALQHTRREGIYACPRRLTETQRLYCAHEKPLCGQRVAANRVSYANTTCTTRKKKQVPVVRRSASTTNDKNKNILITFNYRVTILLYISKGIKVYIHTYQVLRFVIINYVKS